MKNMFLGKAYTTMIASNKLNLVILSQMQFLLYFTIIDASMSKVL
jgi:hypothetical protein